MVRNERLPFFLSVPWCIGLGLFTGLLGLGLMAIMEVSPPSDATRANIERNRRIKTMQDECGRHPPQDPACVQKHWERAPW